MKEQQLSLNSDVAPPLTELKELGGRLIDPRDREYYAELIAWIEKIPRTDEIARIAFLLGYLTLIGRQLPEDIAAERRQIHDLLAKSYSKLNELVKQQADYYDKLTQRLSKLPDEIAAGVKPADIARSMGEAFRQQLVATGIDETKRFLLAATVDLKKVKSDLDAAIQPISEQYGNLIDSLSPQVARLTAQANTLLASANKLEEKNSELRQQIKRIEWYWFATVIVVLLLVGGFIGTQWQARKQSEVRASITALEQEIAQMNDTLKHLPQPALTTKKQGRQSTAK